MSAESGPHRNLPASGWGERGAWGRLTPAHLNAGIYSVLSRLTLGLGRGYHPHPSTFPVASSRGRVEERRGRERRRFHTPERPSPSFIYEGFAFAHECCRFRGAFVFWGN